MWSEGRLIRQEATEVLQQRSEQPHDTFDDVGVPWAGTPFLDGQLVALTEVVHEYSFVHRGGLLVVDVGVDLVVDGEAAEVQIGGTYAGEVVVADECLGMDELSFAQEYSYAGLQSALRNRLCWPGA